MGKMKGLDIDRMNNYDNTEPTDEELKEILKAAHVKTEAEYKDKILEDWNIVACAFCGQDLKLEKAKFINDFPYHKWCAEELGLL